MVVAMGTKMAYLGEYLIEPTKSQINFSSG
jgi:hypothetical protein